MENKFFKKSHDCTKYVDNVFAISTAAKKDDNKDKINATIGSLFNEEGSLYAYKTVFESEKNIDPKQKASYASDVKGNKEFLDTICKFVLENKVNNYEAIATPGGTGALSLSIGLTGDAGDTILYPEIAWGNYKNIATNNNLKSLTYDIYSLEDLFIKIDQVKGKLILLINSPCENPTGHSYTYDEWVSIINRLNSLNKEVVLINDLAYLDYAGKESKKYFELFNKLNDNVLVLLAYSCSKSFSYYGVRLGALIAINNGHDFLDMFINQCSKVARATWSNVNNGAMINVASVLNNHFEEYKNELESSVQLIKERAIIFIEEAKRVNLECYPYTEGFFITVKIDDNAIRDEVHSKLIEKHIYTIKVNKGIRVSICSTRKDVIVRLVNEIKEVLTNERH